MSTHTKLFYHTVARIRAVNNPDGAVFMDRMKTKFHISYVRTAKLKDELISAGVLRKWDLSPENIGDGKGNIIWENLSKFHVPFEITKYEKARVRAEKKRGEYLPRQ